MKSINKFYTLVFIVFILANCNQRINESQLPIQVIELKQDKIAQQDIIANTKEINVPTIVTVFANDLDYNKYEKVNSKQEYYNLADFQGYYAQIIIPFVEEKNIQVVDSNRDTVLCFKIEKEDLFYLDLKSLNYKQGLILFNGKNQPVFWNGKNVEGQLHNFLKQYFKP